MCLYSTEGASPVEPSAYARVQQNPCHLNPQFCSRIIAREEAEEAAGRNNNHRRVHLADLCRPVTTRAARYYSTRARRSFQWNGSDDRTAAWMETNNTQLPMELNTASEFWDRPCFKISGREPGRRCEAGRGRVSRAELSSRRWFTLQVNCQRLEWSDHTHTHTHTYVWTYM